MSKQDYDDMLTGLNPLFDNSNVVSLLTIERERNEEKKTNEKCFSSKTTSGWLVGFVLRLYRCFYVFVTVCHHRTMINRHENNAHSNTNQSESLFLGHFVAIESLNVIHELILPKTAIKKRLAL